MNRKSCTRLAASAVFLLAAFGAEAEIVNISTANNTLLLDASEGAPLRFLYYGDKVPDSDVAEVVASASTPLDAYPVYGMCANRETAMSVTHPDGNMTLDMGVTGVERRNAGNGGETVVKMADKYYPFDINVHYRTYDGSDVIETWVEAVNRGKGIVVLNEFSSAYLPVRYGNVYLTSFYGAPAENTGRTIGAALCYGGNYSLRIDTDDSNYHHFFAGINKDNSAYRLAKGETFATPALALTYSDEGKSGVSRNFHRWARKYKVAHGEEPRKVLLNSWEGVYFDIKEQGMADMMADIASMGGELFVMDDGWTVDTRKLPNGIGGLVKAADKAGVKFGIWIEPEMTNSKSELYEKHPEYIIKPTNREPVHGRGGTQLVLEKTMKRIRAKYPDVTIQACASGGGRANYGILPWFDEIWVSDNTDALQRVYMQWGTSHFFPSVIMASHISAAPNHQTFRTIPLKYRVDVAMSGRLGMEIQPKNMTEDEKALCRNAIGQYKSIRPVVQQGDLYRLLSPYDRKGAASLMYVSPEKDKAVYYWWKTETFVNQQLPRVPMAGLDPDRNYRVTELNRIDNTPLPYEGKTFSGRYLMSNGLEMPLDHNVDYHKRNDYASRVLLLEQAR